MNSNLFKKPPKKLGKYTVDIDQEDLVEIYVKKWVLKWCEKYHPEAFEKGEEFIRGLLKEGQDGDFTEA